MAPPIEAEVRVNPPLRRCHQVLELCPLLLMPAVVIAVSS
jgi:hypothetical protein